MMQFAGYLRQTNGKSTYDFFAGARYYALDLSLDFEPTIRRIKKNINWIDPLVGVKASIPLSDHFKLRLYGDVGGFGMNSQTSWRASGMVDWQTSDSFSLLAGYNTMGFDRKKGSGFGTMNTNMSIYGPVFGASLRF
jgi:hypothetical protein